MKHNLFNSLQKLRIAGNETGEFYSLPQLEKEGVGTVSKLPFSIRILLESVLRNYDGKRIREEDVTKLAKWKPNSVRCSHFVAGLHGCSPSCRSCGHAFGRRQARQAR
jgi:aconitate hydratase